MTSGSKDYFDDLGADWDDLRRGFFSSALRDEALSVAKVRSGRGAADIGAGTGFMTKGLLGRGVEVVAVDQSQGMLTALRRKFADSNAITTKVGEANGLPIETASMDYAFANMYLHHVEDPPRAIREMVRILKPTGTLIVTDLDAHDFTFLQTEHHDLWLGFQRDTILQWFADAGLQDVEVRCAEESCSAEAGSGTSASISIFIAKRTKPQH